MAFSVSYNYEILGNYEAKIRKIANATTKFQGKLDATRAKLRAAGRGLKDFSDRASNLSGVVGTAGIGAAFAKMIGQSSKIEDAMADVARVINMTDTEFKALDSRLTKMSERFGSSKEGLAAIAYEGGKLGITADQIEGFVEKVKSAAIAFDITDEEAGRSIGSIRAKLGLTTDDVTKLLDSVNFLSDNTSASGNKMIEIIERTSGTMKTLHIPPTVSAGFAAFADQVEVSEELAASGLNMMFSRMMKMPGMVDKLMQDPMQTVTETMRNLAKLPEAQRAPKIFKMFGEEAGRFVLKATSNIELLEAAMEKALSPKALGSMAREVDNSLERSSTGFKRTMIVASNTAEVLGDIFKSTGVEIAKAASDSMIAFRNFAAANPMIIKVAGSLGVLLAAISAVGIATGVVSGLVGVISVPILVAVAGIAALVIGFKKWADSGHPIIRTSKRIIGSLVGIFNYIGKVVGATGEFGDAFGILKAFGNVINIFVLKPLQIIFDLLESIVGAITSVLRGDFKGAWEALTKGGVEIIQGTKELVFGEEASNAKAQTMQANAMVDINGEIQVSAGEGSRVDRANVFHGNTGQNLTPSIGTSMYMSSGGMY